MTRRSRNAGGSRRTGSQAPVRAERERPAGAIARADHVALPFLIGRIEQVGRVEPAGDAREEREAKREASCMDFLLTKLAVEETAHRIPRFGAQPWWLFGAVGTKNPVGLVATVFPEFIARDGQERADRGRQGDKRRIGAARRRSRGHGPARLDGTWLRATVASKVMESGETDEQATAGPVC